jgi:hypothetical protein
MKDGDFEYKAPEAKAEEPHDNEGNNDRPD